MSDARQVHVDAADAGQRLDNWLARQLKGVPKSRLYRALRQGEVRVDGRRVGPAHRLAAGEEVRLPPLRVAERAPAEPVSAALAQRLAAAVLLEDDALLVLDKPAGMAVHGGSGVRHGVIEVLRSLRPDVGFLELVHRLDRDTSGCLVIAKQRNALRALHSEMREGRIEKRYLALLAGKLEQERTVNAELDVDRRDDRGERTVAVVAAGGRAASTRFRPVRAYAKATLVEAVLGSGRTHQIRVHAAHLGMPVVGDRRYGDSTAGAPRLMLHAASVAFEHPAGGRRTVTAPLPDDVQAHLATLPAPGRRR